MSILSWLVVERAVADRRLVVVKITDLDLRRTFRLVTLRGRMLSPAARTFTSLVREMAAEEAGSLT